jgi:hypothetical protein
MQQGENAFANGRRWLTFTASMEAVQTFWNFVLLFSTIVFPQLIGVLLFFLLKNRPHFLAHALSSVAPVVLSILFLWMIFIYRYYHLHPDERCGGPLLAALGIMLVGGGLQIVFSTLAQVALHARSAVCARPRV